MMFKLSLKNIKKSIHDYSIYFITLTVAVALSYIFNLVPYQPFMEVFQKNTSQSFGYLLNRISIPIMLIVAGLALYSNNFLLKRRSREIGIYLMLGTKYIKIHMMILIETLFINIGSFIAGVAMGMGLARVFDLLIINMLGLQIEKSSIIFNMSALIETLKNFIIIYAIIAVFNYFVISRANLLDIVRSNGEAIRKKRFKNNVVIQSILLLISVFSIAIFYINLLAPSIDFTELKTKIIILVGLIGHVLMFVSGSGLFAYIINKRKKNLYKGTNLFTMKQITNKISKNGILLSIISFIMTITLIMLNMGVSSHIWIDENLKYTAPYSISISKIQPDVPIDKVTDYIKSKGYSIKNIANYNVYTSNYKLGEFYNKTNLDKIAKEYKFISDSKVRVIRLTDYNKCRKILGFKTVKVPQGYAALSIDKNILPAFMHKDNISLYGKPLKIEKNSVYMENISDSMGVAGFGITIIVNDNVVDNANENLVYTSSLVVNTNEEKIGKSSDRLDLYNFILSYNGGHSVVLKSDMRFYNLKQASVVIFAGLFIGLILLTVGASILSLQLMTEVTENKKGYEIMKKLGVRNQQVHKSVFKQIIIYFMIPLIVASIHSIFGTLSYSMYSHLTVENSTFIYSILMSLCIMFVIYLFYILFTYTMCKKYID